MTHESLRPSGVDVVVAGSGAAGLVAAITAAHSGANVLVLESADEFGGTTALSGGRVWIPGYRSTTDNIETGLQYMRQIYSPKYPEMVEASARTAPEMADFVEATTPHRWVACPNYPDYHTDLPGSRAGGRCFDMVPLETDSLVPEARQVRIPPGYTPITHEDWESWRYPSYYDQAQIEERRNRDIRTAGVALATALVDGAVRAGAQLVSSAALIGAHVDKEGAIESVDVRVAGVNGIVRIQTRALVLATGGYDQDPDLKNQLLPEPLAVSAAAPENTGTTLKLAGKLGAALDNTEEGWWMPMVQVPGETLKGAEYPRGLVRERGAPRQILVNRQGRRFVDEASPYNELGKALHKRAQDGTYPNRDAFLIFDEVFRQKYALPGLAPSGEVPSHVTQAESLEKLASAVGIDANGLQETVTRWNESCKNAVDPDFGRGSNAYDRYYGDPAQPEAPNFGPIDRAPYYAVRMLPGTIGSKGGPVTDVNANVLRPDGTAIAGLYAAGNAAAFWTGDGYPGPGATLAVGMTFGYRAGKAIAKQMAYPSIKASVALNGS
ncbi:succinate dehydrogenase/fumarate reductase flavoprotein subunit [Arthrobacter sp. 1088]|uniref:FAD-dependent oxidoreductase n=1 Tax=Arthrobacter sp. 1088 TaxID=2817768 RepID=UPI002860DDC0|nr:FAD-dependent oxidoreductase [Arthrobacter sp. 1088]MDR6688634.1 succinate dehydrogenase/fumarate reductase flavoprotein subunit [Arthrobacter sp. 1088]